MAANIAIRSIAASSTPVLAATAALPSMSMSLLSTEVTIASWYSASLANNYATPSLLDLLESPLTLNMLEQAAMILVALVALPLNKVRLIPSKATLQKINNTKADGSIGGGGIHTLYVILAMGLANAITARLFMVSLQHLPLSLCHTIRACSPCVAAAIGLTFRRGKNGVVFSSKQLLSLPVILMGFALAVSAQPSCSKVGVYAAIGSLLAMSALQHLSKILLDRGMHEMQCQFLQCSLCLVFLAAGSCCSFNSNTNNNNNNNRNGAYNAFHTIRNLAIRGDGDDGNNKHNEFRLLVLLNGASDYVENVAATKAMALFDELTFSVFDTLRRLSVILICGIGIRKNPARLSNIAGTLLVLVGAFLYQQGSSSSGASSSGSGSGSNGSDD